MSEPIKTTRDSKCPTCGGKFTEHGTTHQSQNTGAKWVTFDGDGRCDTCRLTNRQHVARTGMRGINGCPAVGAGRRK